MNVWLWAATVLLAATAPLAGLVVRGGIADALVALQVTGIVASVVLLLIAEGTGRAPFTDLALVAAFASYVGGLAFARFLERGL
jgi:multicomponent Na+:H+ antiporter subunit F